MISWLQVAVDIALSLPVHLLEPLADSALTMLSSCVTGWDDAGMSTQWFKWVAFPTMI
ncbi:hypothetical protein [Micromonospora sp. WMMD975]|uniref:hypothetical protein n=1 Tax=Micromonospora sp. WMMD975 TaxID=3016087 RepID=UPI002499D8AF|nr:hypothetical protein [Micromonospora sp. WMMD975]WFE33485.1 hypothetical protein O7613_28865 [Micromonospora sp. WMMD975]